MASAIFHRDFNYSSRKTAIGWAVKASPKPQSFPSELITAAVDRGAATLPPRRGKTAIQPNQTSRTPAHREEMP